MAISTLLLERRPWNTRDTAPSTKAALAEPVIETEAQDETAPVVVVGGGPVGLRAAEELGKRGLRVTLLNAERWRPYNRVKLTPFLAGEVQIGQVYQPLPFQGKGRIKLYTGLRAVTIDREHRLIWTQLGRCFPYSVLVLATGSRAHIPNLPGRDLPGVYTFRNFDDVESLMARRARARRAVVIGGGLLGLEAARGMAARRIETTVVEHGPHLMARQLDAEAGDLLAREIERMGVEVRTGAAINAIEGELAVEGVSLAYGERLSADTVLICTGIRANVEIARDAGLAVDRGIRVDDRMRTGDPAIYAVGECAQIGDDVFGLVAPGLEQASIAAANITGGIAQYAPSPPSTKLKAVGVDVFSMGDIEQLDQRSDIKTADWRSDDQRRYRRLVMKRGRLIGALGIGDWQEVNRLQQAIRDRRRIWAWELYRFRRSGGLFGDKQPASVRDWPAAATVCNCTGVSRGQLGDAIALGCDSVAALRRETSASSVCGTCKPHLETLLAMPASREATPGWRWIGFLSLFAVIVAAIAVVAPPWPFVTSVQTGFRLDMLWIDGFWKQVSGFLLLALASLAAFLSIRKRIRKRKLGSYDAWRILHVAVGALALAVLFIHSGFNLGANLNFWLMACFLTLSIAGAITGIFTALEHKFGGAARRPLVWLHIIAFWPLPVLLLVHIVSSYAY